MSNLPFYIEQAARYDRVADQCTIPGLVSYYRNLAAECRRQAALLEGQASEALFLLLDGELPRRRGSG
jgi:hypothetical protein